MSPLSVGDMAEQVPGAWTPLLDVAGLDCDPSRPAPSSERAAVVVVAVEIVGFQRTRGGIHHDNGRYRIKESWHEYIVRSQGGNRQFPRYRAKRNTKLYPRYRFKMK